MKVTNRLQMEGAPPITPGTITVESRHIGSFPADMKPGDTVASDGSRGRIDD